MRKPYVIPLVVLTLSALGATACGSSNNAAARKTAFCGANDKIDKASANVTSAAGFLAVLKANTTALDAMDNNVPAGQVGIDARALVSLARSAVKANNANVLKLLSERWGRGHLLRRGRERQPPSLLLRSGQGECVLYSLRLHRCRNSERRLRVGSTGFPGGPSDPGQPIRHLRSESAHLHSE